MVAEGIACSSAILGSASSHGRLASRAGSLLLSVHGPFLATVSGFTGILGFSAFLTPRPTSRLSKPLWPCLLMATATAFLSSIIAGYCLGYLILLHRGCVPGQGWG